MMEDNELAGLDTSQYMQQEGPDVILDADMQFVTIIYRDGE